MNKATLDYLRYEYYPPNASEEKRADCLVMTTVLEELEHAMSLVDGAYDVVELHQPETPAQVEWKARWLEQARKLVPQG